MELTKQQRNNYKRTLNKIHISDQIQNTLLNHGFYTPFHITAMSKRQFQKQAADDLCIDKKQAGLIYNRAQKVCQKAMHLYMNLKTTAGSAYYRALAGNKALSRIETEFADIPGYQELFGSIDYVEGDAWNSIFGLAAYFVDIMRITDRYLTVPNSDTIPAGMKLQERRPDLWKILLDQKHTEQMVPYLAIVNERLLELAGNKLQTDNPYQNMASMHYPMSLPVSFPLEQIRLIMKQAGASLERIYECVCGDKKAVRRESLQISKDSLDMISSPLSVQQLAEYYGMPEEQISSLSTAGILTAALDISMEQLYALLYQDLQPEEQKAAGRFFINRGCAGGRYIELKDGVLENCGPDGFERINRFVRAGNLFGLSYQQMDWMLQCLSKEGCLDMEFFDQAAAALYLYRQLDIDFDDFIGLFGQMKTYGKDARFERIFNRGSRSYHPAGAWNPVYTDEVIQWNIDNDTQTAAWMAGSMSISMTQLKRLAADLFAEEVIPLTIENMSMLYAHAALSRALSMDIEQYSILQKILENQCDSPTGADSKQSGSRIGTAWQPLTFSRVETLLHFKKSIDKYALSAYDIDFLVNGTVSAYITYRISEDSLHQLLSYIWNWQSDDGMQPEEKEMCRRQFVITSLADYFRTDQEVIEAAEPFFEAVNTLKNKTMHWYDLFLEKPEPGQEESLYADKIMQMLLAMNRWLNVIEDSVSLEIMKSIGTDSAAYGILDIVHMTAADWLSIYEFYHYCRVFGDTQYRLVNCIYFDQAGIQILSDLTSWPFDQISLLLPRLKGSAVQRLAELDAYFSCMNLLDVDIDFMDRLDSIRTMELKDYDAVQALCIDISNSIEIQKQSGIKVPEQMNGGILAGQRDELIRVLCWKMDICEEDLYKYLLMDIRMDDKTQISYIREGANAVQMYLQQCRMGFETGIRYVDIDESWWSWILDYNMWEANRKNYVYPENYLIPSVRHTKTEPFKQVESGLMQSNITDSYVEELCIEYLENIADRMEISIVSACEKDGVTYLFGRTKRQPYTFYYCYREHTPVFTEWIEMEGCSIPSGVAASAVLFGKLHVFWAELKCIIKSMMEDSKSIEGKSYTLDVKYTYRNTQGKWIPPQDLIQNELIYYEENGKSPVDEIPLFKGVFQMNDEIWSRIGILPVSGKNYAPYKNPGLNSEKFIVIYGMPVNHCTDAAGGKNILSDTVGSEGQLFAQKACQILHNAELLKQNAADGWMPAGFVKIFNYNYEQENLLHANEFVVFDEYACKKGASYVSPAADVLRGSFGAALSADMLKDMYSKGDIVLNGRARMMNGEAFIMDGIGSELSARIFHLLTEKEIISSSSIYEPLTVDRDALLTCDLKQLFLDQNKDILGDQPWLVKEIENVLYRYTGGIELLPNGIRPDAKAIPVANCPRQFIIDNIEETFLFTVKEDWRKVQCADLTEGITVAAPLLDACVLRTSTSITFENSIQIIGQLKAHGLLDERHIPIIKNCTLENVKAAVQDKADAQIVYNILLNSPIVSPDLFVSKELGISDELSKKIYGVFEAEGIILENRVCCNLLFETNAGIIFSDLIADGEIKNTWLDEIYQRLIQAPVPVSVKYWTKEGAAADREQYAVMRLSSGAAAGLKAKAAGGIHALLETDSQNHPVVPVLPFDRYEVPDESLFAMPKASDGTAVDFEGLYGEYFWELFYHIPMLTAQNLKNGFMNALCKRWYEYVFNPINKEAFIENTTFADKALDEINEAQSQKIYELLTVHHVINAQGRVTEGYDRDLSYLSEAATQKQIEIVRNILDNYLLVPSNAFYWNFYPFRNYRMEKMLDILSDDHPAICVYNNDPYDPHAVARLRIGAYEKYTMMQYIDNLIIWGDQKFMQNSWEAITAASMYYTIASQMLGKRPEMTGISRKKETLCYQSIADAYPVIPQFLIEAACMCDTLHDQDDRIVMSAQAYYVEDSTYFSVPENDELARYWDLVEDRLYKLRNSLDINGNPRSVPLYGALADPLALAKASYAAGGMMTPAGSMTGTVYPYRFGFLIEQAKGLANVLISIGNQLLSVLEKKDSESYMSLLAANEKALLDLAVQMKESQIKEQEYSLKNLQVSLENSRHRLQYYENLITQDLSEGEKKSLTASDTAFALSTAANVLKLSASAAHALPQLGSPFAMTYGGIQVGAMLDGLAGGMELGASIAGFVSQRSQTMAGYERRRQEWEIQRDSVQYEIDGIIQQMEAYSCRIQAAKTDLTVHQKTIEQKEETLKFLKEKFTSAQLYQWMQGRMNTLMWQSYQLVMELALGAQAAFQYEKDSTRTFLAYEYWDSSKCGLLSGENLLFALEQMQNEYFKQSERKLEVEKHISLALNFPQAFLELKSGGKCTFDLTEQMFDYDYPGMYARKIVSVSISVPALLGPYQTIHATLTQIKNQLLIRPDQEGLVYLLDGRQENAPDSVRADQRVNQKIALSKGVDDAGLISLNFGDERYLPFEGTGAVSRWQLEMPKNTNLFDYNGISDVIVHLKYTAKMDAAFAQTVGKVLNKYPKTGSIYYNLRQNFPLAWNALSCCKEQLLKLEITVTCSASYVKNPKLKGIWLKFDFSKEIEEDVSYQIMSLKLPESDELPVEMTRDVGQVETDLKMEQSAGQWLIQIDTQKISRYPYLQFLMKDGSFHAECLKNIEMLLVYEGGFL